MRNSSPGTTKVFASSSPGLFQPWVYNDPVSTLKELLLSAERFQRFLSFTIIPRVETTLGWN